MSAVMEEPLILDIVPFNVEQGAEEALRQYNHAEVLTANQEASTVAAEALAAFLDLLSGADTEYLAAQEYTPEPPARMLDWEVVSQVLSESQQILIGVQNLLSETLAAMGVEDHQFIRVYAEPDGRMKLLADHPRREEMETILNSPENAELRSMHQAAMTGMGLAGGLVGNISVPDAVLEQIKAKQCAA